MSAMSCRELVTSSRHGGNIRADGKFHMALWRQILLHDFLRVNGFQNRGSPRRGWERCVRRDLWFIPSERRGLRNYICEMWLIPPHLNDGSASKQGATSAPTLQARRRVRCPPVSRDFGRHFVEICTKDILKKLMYQDPATFRF